MKSIATYVLIGLLILSSVSSSAQVLRTPKPTDEQRAMKEDQALRQTPLKIGSNCEPKSFTTKIWIKTLNDAELKHFWLGQRFAVERTYREEVQAERLRKMNNDADAKIAAIESQRDAVNLAAMGIRPYQSPEIDRLSAETSVLLAQISAEIARGNSEWAKRCYRYTDDRSR